ncbi:unnamed protein product [Blepharisma stoltei]|uniref:Uncharacterized protein n=1 Tax=Blepharisma stoltei TaxID=1481888 RepID=A0AAU9JVE3_9CILI|nr:unnamed protein product [Blepharisma stoltei]
MKESLQLTQKNKERKQALELRLRECLSHKGLFKRPDIVPEHRSSEKSSSFLQISDIGMEQEVLSTKGESPKPDEEAIIKINSLSEKLRQEENVRQEIELQYKELKTKEAKSSGEIEKLTHEIEILNKEILSEREIYRVEIENGEKRLKSVFDEKDGIINKLKNELSQNQAVISELKEKIKSLNTSFEAQVNEATLKEKESQSQEILRLTRSLELERDLRKQAQESLEELKNKIKSNSECERLQNELNGAKEYISKLQTEYQSYFKKLNKELGDIKRQNRILLDEEKLQEPKREDNLRLHKRYSNIEENLKANNKSIENVIRKSSMERRANPVVHSKEKKKSSSDLKKVIEDQIAHNAGIVEQIESKLKLTEKKMQKCKTIAITKNEKRFLTENSDDSINKTPDLKNEAKKERPPVHAASAKKHKKSETQSARTLKERCDICFRKIHPEFEHTIGML